MGHEDSPATGYLSAGFVDLQVNGYRGLDLNSGDLATDVVRGLCYEMLGLGVTTFLPTLITASEPEITKALSAFANARHE